MPNAPKPATAATAAVNQEAVARYDMDDRQDFADAERGFIAALPGKEVVGARRPRDLRSQCIQYIADDKPAPDSVNPSLWRQSQVMASCQGCSRSSTGCTRCATTTSAT